MTDLFTYPESMTPVVTHYCPGCTHGVIHRIVGEVIDELGIRDRTVGVGPVGCSVLIYNYFDVDVVDCFAESPGEQSVFGKRLALRGLTGQALIDRVSSDSGLIGVSINSCLHHEVALELARALKSRFEAPVVAGGEHASLVASELVEQGFDFVLRGEGERTMSALARSLDNPAKLRRIPGLSRAPARGSTTHP